MRIIDKLQDYYDYMQDPTDTLVFDRRGSFVLTKKMVLEPMTRLSNWGEHDPQFMLIQAGACYWLVLVTPNKFEKQLICSFDKETPTDYTLELLVSWKNYDRPRKLLQIDIIRFSNMWKFLTWERKSRTFSYENIQKQAGNFKQMIESNEYRVDQNLSQYVKYTDKGTTHTKELQTIPILKACGISDIIDAQDLYLAIDEHLSLNKSESEKREAEGTTNKDKIINHGFDTKTSFRGK